MASFIEFPLNSIVVAVDYDLLSPFRQSQLVVVAIDLHLLRLMNQFRCYVVIVHHILYWLLVLRRSALSVPIPLLVA